MGKVHKRLFYISLSLTVKEIRNPEKYTQIILIIPYDKIFYSIKLLGKLLIPKGNWTYGFLLYRNFKILFTADTKSSPIILQMRKNGY